MTRPVRIPTVHAPNAPRHVLAPLENWLVNSAASGVPFEDGQEFQIGWVRFRIGMDSRGVRVMAPRTGAPALIYVDDCSDALRLVATQQGVLSRFGVEASTCSTIQTALVPRDLDACRMTFIDRLSDEMDDRSGWWIGAHDSQLDVRVPENLKLVSLWEVFSKRPEIGPYLMMPPGWQVSFQGTPVVMRDREPVQPHAAVVRAVRAAG